MAAPKWCLHSHQEWKKADQDLSQITCFHCGTKGHYAKECPKRENYMLTTVTEEYDEENKDEGAEHILH